MPSQGSEDFPCDDGVAADVSFSKSEGITECFGKSFLAARQKKGQREGRQEARGLLRKLF